MANLNELRHKEEQLTAILFACSSWVLLFSTIYVRNGKTYLGINYVQFLVYLVLGLLNAFVAFLYYTQPFKLLYPGSKATVKLKFHKFLRFIVMAFAFTGIWQCVLLPLSGLALVEYCFVFVLLVLMLANYVSVINVKKVKLNFIIKSPMSLVIFQAALFLIKIVTWIIPENIYSAMITGNDSARWCIALICAMFLISGFYTLKRELIPSTELKKNINKQKKLLFDSLKLLILSFANGPLILLIILGCGGLFALFATIKIKDDLLSIVEPILGGLLSTGKYQVQQTPTFVFCQIVAFILYCLYLYFLYHEKQDVEDWIEIYSYDIQENPEVKKLDETRQKEIVGQFKKYYCEYNKDLMFNYDAYKINFINNILQEKEPAGDESND